jgi:hypothetical protein
MTDLVRHCPCCNYMLGNKNKINSHGWKIDHPWIFSDYLCTGCGLVSVFGEDDSP